VTRIFVLHAEVVSHICQRDNSELIIRHSVYLLRLSNKKANYRKQIARPRRITPARCGYRDDMMGLKSYAVWQRNMTIFADLTSAKEHRGKMVLLFTVFSYNVYSLYKSY